MLRALTLNIILNKKKNKDAQKTFVVFFFKKMFVESFNA